MYKVTIPNRERKVIDKLPRPLQTQINNAIEQLANSPKPNGCMKLTNAKDVWRIRVQHHRIGYSIDEDSKKIEIVKVAHRNEFYPKGSTH